MKKFFRFIKWLIMGDNACWYVFAIIVALCAWGYRVCDNKVVSMPRDLQAVTMRDGIMHNIGADTVFVPAGTPVKIYGYIDSKPRLWVETPDGNRGMISQVLVTDTLIAMTDCPLPFTDDRSEIDHLPFETGDSLLIAEVHDVERQIYAFTPRGEVVELDPYILHQSQAPVVHANPKLLVNAGGWKLMTKAKFVKNVKGNNIALIDSAFCPVLYRNGNMAVLGVNVFSPKRGGYYKPILTLDDSGNVVEVGDIDPENFQKIKGLRGFLLRKMPFAKNIIQFLSPTIAHPMYDYETDKGGDRFLAAAGKIGADANGKRPWWAKALMAIAVVVWAVAMLTYYIGYYLLLPFVPLFLVLMLAQRPNPLKFLSNTALGWILGILCIAGCYFGIVSALANPHTQWLIVVAILIVFTIAGVGYRCVNLLEARCPVCKHVGTHEHIGTAWGTPYENWESESKTQKVSSELIGRWDTWTDVTTTTTTTYGSGRKEVDKNTERRNFTEHYKYRDTYRTDNFKVLYRHAPWVKHFRCTVCQHMSYKAGEDVTRLQTDHVGSNFSQEIRHERR